MNTTLQDLIALVLERKMQKLLDEQTAHTLLNGLEEIQADNTTQYQNTVIVSIEHLEKLIAEAKASEAIAIAFTMGNTRCDDGMRLAGIDSLGAETEFSVEVGGVYGDETGAYTWNGLDAYANDVEDCAEWLYAIDSTITTMDAEHVTSIIEHAKRWRIKLAIQAINSDEARNLVKQLDELIEAYDTKS